MRALLLLLVASAAHAEGRFQRFCSRTDTSRSDRGLRCTQPPFFEFANSAGTGMGTECACTAVTGVKGEAITFTRTGAAECVSSTGQLLTQCANNNEPRVSSGQIGNSVLGLWTEPAATNLVLRSRDLSDAVWVKTDMTCAKTATGMRNDANGASTCTASAANGTVLQNFVVAAATRSTSFRIKRRTGTGTVEVTRNNGTTWSDITASLDSTWKWVVPEHMPGCQGACIKVTAMTSGIADPTVGIRIVTSGDAVDVDFVQDEAGAVATTPIATVAASESRNAELATGPAIPAAGTGCLAVTGVMSSATGGFVGTAGVSHGLLSLGAAANRLYVENVSRVTSSVSISTGGVYRITGFWTSTLVSITINGTTDTSAGAVVATPQTFRIGNAYGGGTPSIVSKLISYDGSASGCAP